MRTHQKIAETRLSLREKWSGAVWSENSSSGTHLAVDVGGGKTGALHGHLFLALRLVLEKARRALSRVMK